MPVQVPKSTYDWSLCSPRMRHAFLLESIGPVTAGDETGLHHIMLAPLELAVVMHAVPSMGIGKAIRCAR